MEQKKWKAPMSEATLRKVLMTVIHESIPNLPTLREKEWAMREMERLKTDKLEGDRRMIKNTGVVRKIDQLGRVVIPMELRRSLHLAQNAEMEMSLDDANGWIVLEERKDSCHFCGSKVDVNKFKDKFVCDSCVDQLFKSV